MNNTQKVPQKSSIYSKNPYPATGLTDSNTTSPIEALLSRIKADFGRNCQNLPIFAARASFEAAQKTQKNQKTTVIKPHCGFNPL